MGKLFKISGSFRQNGFWARPDPAFVGEIIMTDDHMFCGYCDELCKEADDAGDKIRYLLGSFIDRKDENQGIEFYKMSNDARLMPLLYRIENLATGGDGTWYACLTDNGACFFLNRGDAKISVEEQPCSKKALERVRARFNEVNEDLYWNYFLINTLLATS